MFENVPLFEHMHSKCAKSANMTQKMFWENYCGVSKRPNFIVIPQILEMGSKMF